MKADEITRPRTVELAIFALAVTLIAGLIRAVFGTNLSSVPLDPLLFYGLLFGSCAVGAVILHKIWAGKNWARVVYALFFCLGLFKTVPVLIALLQASIASGLLSAAVMGVKVVSVALLFFPTSNRWFQHRRQQL